MTASITASIPRGAHVEHTDLRAISFHHVRFLGLGLVDVEITGEIEDVTINGVNIGPLIEAELDRRMPDRARMRPTTVEGFQEACAILERLWGDPSTRRPGTRPTSLDEAPGWEGVPWDREARPSLDEVLDVRRKRQGMVGDVLAALTPEQLDETVTRNEPGWPQLEDLPVTQCLLIVLDEEWHHRLYAERDLDAPVTTTKEN